MNQRDHWRQQLTTFVARSKPKNQNRKSFNEDGWASKWSSLHWRIKTQNSERVSPWCNPRRPSWSKRSDDLKHSSSHFYSFACSLFFRLDQNNTSLKMLHTSMGRLHRDIQSLDAVIAKNDAWSRALANQNYTMENEVMKELKALESEVRRVEDTIQNSTYEKR